MHPEHQNLENIPKLESIPLSEPLKNNLKEIPLPRPIKEILKEILKLKINKPIFWYGYDAGAILYKIFIQERNYLFDLYYHFAVFISIEDLKEIAPSIGLLQDTHSPKIFKFLRKDPKGNIYEGHLYALGNILSNDQKDRELIKLLICYGITIFAMALEIDEDITGEVKLTGEICNFFNGPNDLGYHLIKLIPGVKFFPDQIERFFLKTAYFFARSYSKYKKPWFLDHAFLDELNGCIQKLNLDENQNERRLFFEYAFSGGCGYPYYLILNNLLLNFDPSNSYYKSYFTRILPYYWIEDQNSKYARHTLCIFLRALDKQIKEGKNIAPISLLSLLLWPIFQIVLEKEGENAADKIFSKTHFTLTEKEKLQIVETWSDWYTKGVSFQQIIEEITTHKTNENQEVSKKDNCFEKFELVPLRMEKEEDLVKILNQELQTSNNFLLQDSIRKDLILPVESNFIPLFNEEFSFSSDGKEEKDFLLRTIVDDLPIQVEEDEFNVKNQDKQIIPDQEDKIINSTHILTPLNKKNSPGQHIKRESKNIGVHDKNQKSKSEKLPNQRSSSSKKHVKQPYRGSNASIVYAMNLSPEREETPQQKEQRENYKKNQQARGNILKNILKRQREKTEEPLKKSVEKEQQNLVNDSKTRDIVISEKTPRNEAMSRADRKKQNFDEEIKKLKESTNDIIKQHHWRLLDRSVYTQFAVGDDLKNALYPGKLTFFRPVYPLTGFAILMLAILCNVLGESDTEVFQGRLLKIPFIILVIDIVDNFAALFVNWGEGIQLNKIFDRANNLLKNKDLNQEQKKSIKALQNEIKKTLKEWFTDENQVSAISTSNPL